MKKHLVAAILISLATVGLAGCDEEPQKTVEQGNWSKIEYFTDPDTGVQYLLIDGDRKAAMTVRLNPDGTPFIEEVDK